MGDIIDRVPLSDDAGDNGINSEDSSPEGEEIKSIQTAIKSTGDIPGISITGYKYPYSFIGIVAVGGMVGAALAWKYNQGTVGYLALISIGLIAASSLGLQINQPVKEQLI